MQIPNLDNKHFCLPWQTQDSLSPTIKEPQKLTNAKWRWWWKYKIIPTQKHRKDQYWAPLLREGCKKSKWKFKMAFAIRCPTPPPPLMAQISRHFFYPTFFFCNWILHIWNGFYTSKISLLSPLIIGSKLTFISSSGRWLPTI